MRGRGVGRQGQRPPESRFRLQVCRLAGKPDGVPRPANAAFSLGTHPHVPPLSPPAALGPGRDGPVAADRTGCPEPSIHVCKSLRQPSLTSCLTSGLEQVNHPWADRETSLKIFPGKYHHFSHYPGLCLEFFLLTKCNICEIILCSTAEDMKEHPG